MRTRKQILDESTFRSEKDVEKRVYATLVGNVATRGREVELCRKLASLARSLHDRRSLSDEDIDELLYAVARD